MAHFDPSAHDEHNDRLETQHEYAQPPTTTTADQTPAVGETPPHILAREAAEGRRGAAWRLMVWITHNDPRAVTAVASLDDDRLAYNLLEFIALGTWAGKPFVVPIQLRSAFARTRLRTLFLTGSAIEPARAQRVLLSAIRDQHPTMRGSAAYLFGLMEKREVTPLIIAMLNDPDLNVRSQAVKALGHLEDARGVPALLAALHGADEQLGAQIFMALVMIGPPAVPALIEHNHSRSAWTRWHCVRALGEIRDERAIPTLVNALNDNDHAVAWMAAKSLVGFGRQTTEPILRLLALREASPWLIETSSFVLRDLETRHSRLRPYLEPVIHDMHEIVPQVTTTKAASTALTQLANNGLLPPPPPPV